ncbi:hypothetical protein CHY08_32405 (plasmid) [Rhizobium leguminosarum bv. viciae]|nr:hypothetical protein CHY08_32405 [Rhizobium leguminosarum bv. viciae]
MFLDWAAQHGEVIDLLSASATKAIAKHLFSKFESANLILDAQRGVSPLKRRCQRLATACDRLDYKKAFPAKSKGHMRSVHRWDEGLLLF